MQVPASGEWDVASERCRKWWIQLTFLLHMSTNCAVNEPMLCGPSRCMCVALECFELLKTTEFN